jgi:hypothetical protein
MKTAATGVLLLVLAAIVGCQSSSPRGGDLLGTRRGFKIAVPGAAVKLNQGREVSVPVKLQRDRYFRQDVQLSFRVSEGLSIQPTEVLIKASDLPETAIQVRASAGTALAHYRVIVTGTPAEGKPSSVAFDVRVVSP